MPLDTKKRLATVQIDVDGTWVVFQHFGYKYQAPQDIMYESALPRFLDLFDAYGVKATLFTVGRDLLFAPRVRLLQEAVKRGHEIANHTMNHAEGFSFLSRQQKEKEIADADAAIRDTLGVIPRGFRTPSNDVDSDTLKILQENGYLYDSSLLPIYYSWLIKRIKFASLNIQRKDHYLGRAVYGLAPLAPYHPSENAVWRKGKMRIIEVPITTMPFFRIPFHVSFTLALYELGWGTALFDAGYALLNITGLPLNIVFHTNELSDSVRDPRIRRQLGLNVPLVQKEKVCRRVLSMVRRDFHCVTTYEYALGLATGKAS